MTNIIFFDRDNNDALIAIIADAVPEQGHKAPSQSTDTEVEVGVDITNHVRPKPRTISLQVVVSNTPSAPNAELGGADAGIDLRLPRKKTQGLSTNVNGRPQAGTITDEPEETTFGIAFQPDSEPTRIQDTWRKLMDARERALLGIVTTSLETYSNVVLENVECVRTAADGSWARLSLSFKEIRQASSQLVDDPLPAQPRNRREVDRGAKATVPPAEQLRSTFVQGEQVLGGLGIHLPPRGP